MITEKRFEEIGCQVEDAFNQALDKVKNLSLGNYVLFLGDGEYMDDYKENPVLNPYFIGVPKSLYADTTRLIFLQQFLKIFYSFKDNTREVIDDSFRINLEFMIYSHIWESWDFLKKMYRLAHLSNGEEYAWKVRVPGWGKQKFIRMEIKECFIKSKLDFGKIIPKVFHSQLRNAFAHSQYSIDIKDKQIFLANYKGKNWQLYKISLNEWSERFAYSIWMSYSLLKIIVNRRLRLIEDFGTNTFDVKLPSKDGKSLLNVNVIYIKEKDTFCYKQPTSY